MIKFFNSKEIQEEFNLTDKELFSIEIAALTDSRRLDKNKKLRKVFKSVKLKSKTLEKEINEVIKNKIVKRFLLKKIKKRGVRKCKKRNWKKVKIW